MKSRESDKSDMEVKWFDPRSRRCSLPNELWVQSSGPWLITTVLVLMCGDLKFDGKQKIFYKNRQNNFVPSRDLGYQALGWGIRDNLIFSNLMPIHLFCPPKNDWMPFKVFQGQLLWYTFMTPLFLYQVLIPGGFR